MKLLRRRWIDWLALWTALLLVVALLLAGEAVSSLYSGEQACYMNYPAVPCPGRDDAAIVRLTLAFFGLPAIWVLGVGIGIAPWMVRRRTRPGV